MADEVQINVGMNVNVPNTAPYRRQFQFQRDHSSYQGPTPGYLTATVTGIEVSLALLTNPSVAWVQNLSTLYRIVIGIKDTSSGIFYPLLELDPLESWPLPLARMIGDELTGGSGSGTAGSGGVLWVKSITGSADFVFEAFGR